MKKILPAAIAVLALAGCGAFNDQRGKGDAPVANRKGDDAPARVVNMPDGFSNVAFKCIDSNGLYVTTKDAAPVVVADDPLCVEGAS